MPDVVVVSLKWLLEKVVQNGLPMLIVYWILERPFIAAWLLGLKDFFQEQLGISLALVKRYSAILLSVGISVGAYAMYAGLGYADMPVGFEAWSTLVITMGAINFTGSQIVQAKDLRKYA